jgi:hypothetical protein
VDAPGVSRRAYWARMFGVGLPELVILLALVAFVLWAVVWRT